MREVVNNPADDRMKRATIPYIERYLKKSGLNVQRDNKSLFVNFGYNLGFHVCFQKSKLSIAVALPVCEDEAEETIIIANITMAYTMMTKVFLLHDDNEDLNLWFTVESFCKTRSEFERDFDSSFKLLLNSVKTYIKIRKEIMEAKEAKTIINLIMEHNDKGQPS